MKLLIATPSPYARKARVALIEKGLAFSEEVTVPWNKDTSASQHNPLGKIPVLLLDDGRAIYDSRVIVEYLDTVEGTVALIPSEPQARIAVKMVEALADGVSDAIVLVAIEARRERRLQSRDWIKRQQAKIEAGIAELDRQLGDRTWFVGDGLTVADIAAAATLGYARLRMPEFNWFTPYPRLRAFSDRLEARPSFLRTQPQVQTIEEIH
jgi:glutathione S-transferase